MRRITPDEVKAAYERTGIVPATCCWYGLKGGSACGCALTAMCIDAGHVSITLTESKMNYVQDALGLDPHYTRGFLFGFDGVNVNDCQGAVNIGHEDGVACAEAMGL
jgi:hypothetical protein